MSQLFATKSLKQLLDEMAGENRLRRVLGPLQLTSLGVGAIIGAGIFVATGSATVANGWSGYFQSVIAKFGWHFPAALAGPPIIYDTAAGAFVRTAGIINLPAVIIVGLVTYVLVKG